MHLEDAYVRVREIVDAQNTFGRELNKKFMLRILLSVLMDSPLKFVKLYTTLINAYREDRMALLPPDVKAMFHEAYETCIDETNRNDEAFAVYISDSYLFGLARLIATKIPKIDFHGLLAVHDFRRVDHAILRDKKLLACTAAALFALIQKADVKILEGLTLKVPYTRIPSEVQQGFWLCILLIALSLSAYFFFIYRKKQSSHRWMRQVLMAGKILSDSKKREE